MYNVDCSHINNSVHLQQHVSDSFFVSPSRYFVVYSISTSDDKCNSISAILATSCDEGVCTDVLDIPSSCNLNADGVVAVFASNPLGNGTRSDEFRIGNYSTMQCHHIYI